MTEHKGNLERTSAECVDPETVPGEVADTDGARFQFTEATCNGLECPPYVAEKELTGAVRTK